MAQRASSADCFLKAARDLIEAVACRVELVSGLARRFAPLALLQALGQVVERLLLFVAAVDVGGGARGARPLARGRGRGLRRS